MPTAPTPFSLGLRPKLQMQDLLKEFGATTPSLESIPDESARQMAQIIVQTPGVLYVPRYIRKPNAPNQC